jgi:2-polyprenyl-3-methyl-5-hydroxy-6-metoxy-1,4-benzoquinol methylase
VYRSLRIAVEPLQDFSRVFSREPYSVVRVTTRVTGKDCAVPSFVKGPHYAENFGKQWARFQETQLDSQNGTSISKDYLEQLIGCRLEALAGQTVLEVGAGAGRFTEHFVRHARLVVAVDLSDAIFVNAALGADNLVAAQADLTDMPMLTRKFDLVYCRGVLQHTPDPERSIALLHRWVKPTGFVAFDIYAPGTLRKFGAKYVLRPIIQRVFTYDSFLAFLGHHAEWLLRLRWKVKPFLPWKIKQLLDFLVPVYDYRGVLPLTDGQLVEWGKLDTLDAMFAKYDNPMAYEEVMALLRRLHCRILSSDPRMNCFRTTVTPEFLHETAT